MDDVPRPLPPHLNRERTRHGAVAWYVRVDHGKRIRIREDYGTADFWDAYRAALEGKAASKGLAVKPNSLRWLIKLYMESADWASLSPATRKQRGNIYKTIAVTAGDIPLKDLRKREILAGRERRKDKPHSANNFLKAMRGLMGWAVTRELRPDDPTKGIALLVGENDAIGFHSWSEDEVAAFEACWPLGTRQRLALDILLYTGARRGDAVRLGRQHLNKGNLSFRTEKTGELVTIPLLPPLEKSIAATANGGLTYLVTERGGNFTKESFGNWFRKACTAAGVPGSAHGLRKAGARRAAENGASEAQLNAVFGWKEGSRESATYVRAANRARIAEGAASMLMVRSANKSARTKAQGKGRTTKN